MKPLSTKELAGELNKPISTVQRWARMRLIPHMSLGHRTKLYALDKVLAALQKLEVKAK